MESDKIYQIILSVLDNEATDQERHILSEWLKASEENEKEFQSLKRLYMRSTPVRKVQSFDIEQAWMSVRNQTIDKKKSFRLSTWTRYVAMIAIVISAGLYFFTGNLFKPAVTEINIEEYDQPTLLLENGEKIALTKEAFSKQQKEIVIKNDAKNNLTYESKKELAKATGKKNHLIIPKGKSYQLTLSDGSRIWLNSETELIYPDYFSGDKREVTLIGEAFFDVAKDKNKPFIVKANGVDVKVLGTSFNICSYTKDPAISTTLVEGSVAVLTEKGEEEIISPSEQLVYNKAEKKTITRVVDTDLYTSWMNGTYIFKNIPLEEIMIKLQRWYDFTVTYQDNLLRNNRYSLVVDKNTSLDQLLEIISFTSDIKLERNNNTIHIKRQGGNMK